MTLRDCYKIFDGDYACLCRRFPEPFIRQLLFIFLDDPSFALMERAIKCGDSSAAYIYLTALRDAALNLSFTPLAAALCDLAPALKSGCVPLRVIAGEALFRTVKVEYTKTVGAIARYKLCCKDDLTL